MESGRGALYASVWERFLVVPGLILTTVGSTLLFATRLDRWTSSADFATFVNVNRSAVGIFVQILSHLLGMIHVYALCWTINLSSRTYLAERSFPLVLVKFLNAICGNRLDLSLPWLPRAGVALFLMVTLLPSALWAGALTPIDSASLSVQNIRVPAYSNMTLLKGMPYHSQLRDIYNLNNDKGVFTFAPEFDLQGLLLNLAADASNRTGGASAHSKLDKTGYVYTGRSYGVGAPVGIKDGGLLASTTAYNYTEVGLLAETSCIYNDTANFMLGPNILEGDGFLLEVFEAQGSLPWGNDDIDFTTGGFNAGAIVALITASNETGHILAITTGANESDWYGPLKNVQCDLSFSSMDFSVAVDRVNQSISVEPTQDVDMPPFGKLVSNATVNSMSVIGQALATTMYVSILGQNLMYNIANVEAELGVSNSSKLLGIEGSINSIMDNILLSYSSAQMVIQNDTVDAPADSQISAVVLGTPLYVFPIFALNLLFCLLYLIEAGRTLGWSRATSFNFMDAKHVIVGSSSGGTAIANEARALRNNAAADKLRLRLALSPATGTAAVLLAGERTAWDPINERAANSSRNLSIADDGAFLLQDFRGSSKVPTSPMPDPEPEPQAPEISFSSSYQPRDGEYWDDRRGR